MQALRNAIVAMASVMALGGYERISTRAIAIEAPSEGIWPWLVASGPITQMSAAAAR